MDVHKYGIMHPLHDLPEDLVDGFRSVQRGYDQGRSELQAMQQARAEAELAMAKAKQ